MGTIVFPRLVEKITDAIEYYTAMHQWLERSKAVAGVLLYESTRYVEEFAPVGIGKPADIEQYRLKARMKIISLRLNPKHISSFQSRDSRRGMYGGGLRVENVGCFAIYGIDEYVGEACLLYGLQALGVIDTTYLKKVFSFSQNPHRLMMPHV